MSVQNTVYLILGVPLLASLLVPLVHMIMPQSKLKEYFSVSIALLTNLLAWTLVPSALDGETATWSVSVWQSLDAVFRVDALSVFVAVTASFLALLIVIYSVSYMEHNEHLSEYYLLVLLFIGSMMGLVFSSHLIYLYIFWELSSLCSWRLISFYRKKEYVEKGVKAFLLTFAGAALMALGFLLIYNEFGTFDLVAMQGEHVGGAIVLLILMGILTKSATFPLHTWLPDAGVAPSTVTSLLHAAVLVKIGIYAFARLFGTVFHITTIEGYDWQPIIIGVLLVSAVISGCAALSVKNIKKVLAYSTVSQLAFIMLGLAALEGHAYEYAVFYILAHGTAKAGLFLCAGIIEHATGTKEMPLMGGLKSKLPLTTVSFALCSLSIMGLYPFGGYFAKHGVLAGLVDAGFPLAAWIAFGASLLTMAYLGRAFWLIFLGEPRAEEAKKAHKEGTKSMVSVVGVLAGLSLVLGIFNSFPLKLAEVAKEQSLFAHAEEKMHAISRSFFVENYDNLTLGLQIAALLLLLEIIRRKASQKTLPALLSLPIRGIQSIAAFIYSSIERMIDLLAAGLIKYAGEVIGGSLQAVHNGVLQNYAVWVLGGMVLIALSLFI